MKRIFGRRVTSAGSVTGEMTAVTGKAPQGLSKRL